MTTEQKLVPPDVADGEEDFVASLQSFASYCESGAFSPDDGPMLASKFRDATFVVDQLMKLRDGKIASGFRLAPAAPAAPAQEPVAHQWRYRPNGVDRWTDWQDGSAPDGGLPGDIEERDLYAAPVAPAPYKKEKVPDVIAQFVTNDGNLTGSQFVPVRDVRVSDDGSQIDVDLDYWPPAPVAASAVDGDALRAAAIAGWNACRRSVYAVCEDAGAEYGKHVEDTENEARYHFGRGGANLAKSIAGGFSALEAEDDDNFTEALAALTATPSSPNPVADNPAGDPVVNAPRVRELRWNEYEREGDIDQWDAEAGKFHVYYGVELHHDGYRAFWDGEAFGPFDTLEAAKSAAQSDYERRVLACLVDAPVAAGWLARD